jgi:hypothetical protein
VSSSSGGFEELQQRAPELSGQEQVFSVAAQSSRSQRLGREPSSSRKTMSQNFIFAQDVILDPDTGKIVAVVRNGGVWHDGSRIAVLLGAHMYDLNGNLLGKLAAGDGSLPISFKNLVERKSAQTGRALDGEGIGTAGRQIGVRVEPRDDWRARDSP